jgi:hypothetical protein
VAAEVTPSGDVCCTLTKTHTHTHNLLCTIKRWRGKLAAVVAEVTLSGDDVLQKRAELATATAAENELRASLSKVTTPSDVADMRAKTAVGCTWRV